MNGDRQDCKSLEKEEIYINILSEILQGVIGPEKKRGNERDNANARVELLGLKKKRGVRKG